MKTSLKSSFLLSLYAPWILATLLQAAPTSSYIVAWLGSFFIYYQTWFSPSRYILKDRKIENQLLRPLFIQQFIFAGFMCCTSIFYFFNALGYKYFEQVSKMDITTINENLDLIATCQRFSVLGHAALVTGILLAQRNADSKTSDYKPDQGVDLETWVVRISIISFIICFIMERTPGLFQFSLGFYNVTIFCGALTFVNGIKKNNPLLLGFGGAIFLINLAVASLSGYKEPLIVNSIILFSLLYPYYKREVGFVAVPFFIFLFYVAPTYSSVIRQQAWKGESTAEDARQDALETIVDDGSSFEDTNWAFLTGRLSEIGMFTQFVRSTPEIIPYYHTAIIENALMSIVPRALWKDKPITEEIAMERVYDAGVVNDRSNVSAKARPIVDGYLSAGFIGIIIYMVSLGFITQSLSNIAENFFGGYETGTVIFFSGFFQILWRGESTEFMVNTVFWGAVAMMLFWLGLRFTNYIEKTNPLDYTKI